MYTSGSTGTPKGVTIPHRGVLLFARWAERTFGWTSETVIANQAPLYFDVSVMDVYGAMRCGGHLILTPEALFHFPNKLPEFLRDNAVTHIYWVPTVMINIANSGALDGVELPALRTIAFAGEVMPNKQLNVWRRALPGRVFANLYGPTETDVCTAYVVDREFADSEPLPIGSPLPDMHVLLLGEDGKAVKHGETGEICVSGSGILLGYWNDAEKTASAVVSDPDNRRLSHPLLPHGRPRLVERARRAHVLRPPRRPDQAARQPHRARRNRGRGAYAPRRGERLRRVRQAPAGDSALRRGGGGADHAHRSEKSCAAPSRPT